MPAYDYKCDLCGTTYEIRHGFHESPQVQCVICADAGIPERYCRKLISQPLYASVRLSKGEIRELGHLAERNSEGLSDDHKVHLDEKHRTKKVGPDGQVLSRKSEVDKETVKRQKKLRQMTPEQKKRYIQTGEAV